MGKNNRNNPSPAAPASQGPSVQFMICPRYKETVGDKLGLPGIKEKLGAFIKSKAENKIAPFGAKDFPFVSGGPLGKAVPGLKHAHLTQDISVFYTIGGSNPSIIKLYGLFTHQESGTGNTGNVKVQQSLGKSLAGQDFSPLT